ncbi:DHH family phosphoesterase [bacterium]|nr:DHH family phosphoesterase [bacterium]
MLSINQRMANVSFKANVMPKNQAQHIDNILHSGKSVDIFCHSISDEDTFNSATAFYNYLKQDGINARIIASGGKSNYGYDTGKYNIIQAKDINDETKKADIALCVDFSSKDRLNSNVYKHLQKYDASKIVGIDHHDDKNKLHPDFNQITKVYEKNQVPELEAKNYYIDSSAKSNCGIIYRFFEALGKTPDKEISKALYTGFTDDTAKSKCELDKNSKEVKAKLTSALNLFDIAKIKKHFVEKTLFTKEEKAFAKNLQNRIQYSQNGKLAYVEIKNDDEEWNNIGRNTEKAAIILGKFRKETLANNKNLESVAVFYPCDDGMTYKMSITSNNDYAMRIVDYAKEHYSKDIVAGGHPERCGGTVLATNPIEQHNWVNYFVNSSDKITY